MTNMLLDKQWACIRKCPKALIVVVKAPLHSLCLERLVTSFAALLLLL